MSLSGKQVLEFQRVVQVRFPKGGDWAYMALAVGAERDPKSKKPKWKLREDRAMAVVCRSKLEAKEILQEYGARWRIESFFRAMANDVPAPAPKTIPMHAIMFIARVLHVALACRNLLESRAKAQSGFVHGLRIGQWTVCDEAQALLDQRPRPGD